MAIIKKLFWGLSSTYALLLANAAIACDGREVSSSSSDVYVKLETLLSPVQSLSGEFTQQIIDIDGELIQSSSGDFLLNKPGQLRWHTEEPFPQLLVTNGSQLWLYDPDLEQVTVKTLAATYQDTPAAILSGNMQQIKSLYQVSANTSADNQQGFIFTPLSEQSVFETLSLTFSNNTISNMTLKDNLGQTTQIDFSNLIANPQVSDADFIFEPPSGTDILIDD